VLLIESAHSSIQQHVKECNSKLDTSFDDLNKRYRSFICAKTFCMLDKYEKMV